MIGFSLTQVADCYQIKVSTLKSHAEKSGLSEYLPKVLNYRATIYPQEALLIMRFLGESPKLARLAGVKITAVSLS
ncbi:hypothetical protein SAMN04515674_101453 [Pseudarcicella hirudinis]|uniref:Uncharacterized protein n=1 Tax=Pseudarcicella hirudinis TaxID=1079859 RepID=A0A1I5MUH6_9BACT|nr:hypothetical protein [Pseudarcicella hirudinis]SFP13178.1 hypothetical protein SAMN04515674_101453 [Pseudarcicella hirudinis]